MWPKEVKNSYNMSYPLLLLLAPIIAFWMVETLQNGDIFNISLYAVMGNLILYMFYFVIIFSILKSSMYTVVIGEGIFFIVGLINRYVLEFRQLPLLPTDLLSIDTAFKVLNNYKYEWFNFEVIICIFVFSNMIILAYLFSDYKINNSLKVNMGLGIIICIIFSMLFTVIFKMDILEKLKINPYQWKQDIGYINNGFLLSFIGNTKYLLVEKPDDYDSNEIRKFQNKMSNINISKENKKSPNIIAIMDESFSELKEIFDLETRDEYIPFINSMDKNILKGTLLVSSFAGNTCNTEFEFLTSNSMAFLPRGSIPYQQYIDKSTDGLVSILNNQGYESIAIHPYSPKGWNRVRVYKHLGFSNFLSEEDFKSPGYIRGYISDESSFEKIIEVYNNRDKSKGIFIFNVTMQNHGGYNIEDNNYEKRVYVKNIQEAQQIDEYLSLINKTDSAVQNLIDYFNNIDEPTVILFFGDHQPGLNEQFYENIDKNSLEELQKKYKVPFFIWTNFDRESKQLGTISSNYLATVLLEVCGLEIPQYNIFLGELMNNIPAINSNGYLDKDGIYHYLNEDNEYKDLLYRYSCLQYNNLFDKYNKLNS